VGLNKFDNPDDAKDRVNVLDDITFAVLVDNNNNNDMVWIYEWKNVGISKGKKIDVNRIYTNSAEQKSRRQNR
jgi:hypothetical protein